MEREYRIIRDGRLVKGETHYAQTRTKKKFLFWTTYTPWKRIGKHVCGFGLYDHLDWPKSYNECIDIVSEYRAWISREKLITVSHSYQ